MIALAVLAAVSLAQAAAASAIPAVASGPLEAPVLDKERGARALEAYRKFRRQLCADLPKHGGERAVDYRFDGQRFRGVTPTPKAVQAVLDKG